MLTLALFGFASGAHAAPTLDVGLGWRRTFDAYDGRPMGVRAFGRVGLGDHVAIEAGAYGRLPGKEVSGLAQTLVAISYEGNNETSFRQPVDREAASLSAFVVASPWERRHDKRTTAWVYGMAGVDVRAIIKDYATVNPDYAAGVAGASPAVTSGSPETVLVPGPALGVGFDAWFFDRFGVRTTVVERFAVQEEPDYGNKLADGSPMPLEKQLTLSAALSVDLMVRF